MTSPAAAGRLRIASGGHRRRVGAPGRGAARGLALGFALMLLSAWPASAAAAPPVLTARAGVLIAPQTGQTLYAANAQRELPIASTTKLMTALVVLQHVPSLDTVFTEPSYYAAPSDSQIGLVPGERMTVRDLLVAMMLPSADDAAEDLAYNVGRGPGHSSLAAAVAHFVSMMNLQARALGLRQTHYTTPIGLDTPGNYSTAADLVKLTTYDMTHSPFLAQVVALPRATLRSGNQVREVTNRNDLVGRYPWIDGVKTGHTLGAGYVLVASGERRGLRLTDAVLGTSSESSRDANALALLEYGFTNFRLLTGVRAGQVLAKPSIQYRSGQHASLIAAGDVRQVVARGAAVRLKVSAPGQLTGPLPRHAVLGTVTMFVGGRAAARVRLLLARALPEVSPLSIAAGFILQPLPLLVIILLAGGGVALAFHLRQRRRGRGKRGLRPA